MLNLRFTLECFPAGNLITVGSQSVQSTTTIEKTFSTFLISSFVRKSRPRLLFSLRGRQALRTSEAIGLYDASLVGGRGFRQSVLQGVGCTQTKLKSWLGSCEQDAHHAVRIRFESPESEGSVTLNNYWDCLARSEAPSGWRRYAPSCFPTARLAFQFSLRALK